MARPSDYDKVDFELVARLAKAGCSDVQIAAALDVDRTTLWRWGNSHEEFRNILKGWKDTADDAVERSLYERAVGYEHPEDKIFQFEGTPVIVPTIKRYPPDTAAAFIWLKNRRRSEWREKVEDPSKDDLTLSKLDALTQSVQLMRSTHEPQDGGNGNEQSASQS